MALLSNIFIYGERRVPVLRTSQRRKRYITHLYSMLKRIQRKRLEQKELGVRQVPTFALGSMSSGPNPVPEAAFGLLCCSKSNFLDDLFVSNHSHQMFWLTWILLCCHQSAGIARLFHPRLNLSSTKECHSVIVYLQGRTIEMPMQMLEHYQSGYPLY